MDGGLPSGNNSQSTFNKAGIESAIAQALADMKLMSLKPKQFQNIGACALYLRRKWTYYDEGFINTPLVVRGDRTSSTIGIRPDPFSRGRL